MGYFFRPRFPHNVWMLDNPKLWEMLSKEMDAKKNKYSFAGPIVKGKEFSMWRWWGHFIHQDHYKDFIERLFIVVPDPTEPDLYQGNTIWRRRFNTNIKDDNIRGDAFNKKFINAFTLPECNEAFSELKQLIIEDTTIDWETDKEFLANLKQSLKYIMFSKWEDYEAY